MQILCDPTDIVRSCWSGVILPIVFDPANLLMIHHASVLNILQICLLSCKYVGGPVDLLVALSCRSFVIPEICCGSCIFVADPADVLVIQPMSVCDHADLFVILPIFSDPADLQ